MNEAIKIFIVEDELIAAESLSIDLTKLGYQVIGKANCQEKALQSISKTHPDLVLMDIKLKGDQDGINIAEEIQKNWEIPVVYLTAYADEKTLQRAKKTYPYGYIVKPYKIQDLQTSIVIALNKHQQLMLVQKTLNREQKKLHYLTTNDPITKLPNQLSLLENFEGIVECLYQQNKEDLSQENTEESEAFLAEIIPIFYINLDRFSLIRDEFGNELANFLLRGITERLKSNVPPNSIISSLQGDEFAIVIPPISTKQVAIDLAKKLISNIHKPFNYQKQEIFVDLSIGISFYPLQGEDIYKLLRNAKKALEKLQKLGGNQYQVYSPAFHSYNPKEIELETKLNHALENNELEVFYQPIIAIETGKIIGAEALLRWKTKDEGLISPSVFIPIAEQTGLIETMGDWVLQTACFQTQTLHQKGFSDLKISVNFSARQFNQEDLAHKIGIILATTALNARYLQIELRESILVDNPTISQRKLAMLKNLGLQIAIDDFGTGYSSLSYLQNFQFDLLKIDRCFVTNINNNYKNTAITQALIEMSHQLKLQVVAEGVETQAELAFLQQHNCDYFQGYLFSRPLPFSEYLKLLQMKK
jgi:diguanylate cyclase (GGDEF)-like protein